MCVVVIITLLDYFLFLFFLTCFCGVKGLYIMHVVAVVSQLVNQMSYSVHAALQTIGCFRFNSPIKQYYAKANSSDMVFMTSVC
jgi:hypothetical protein